MFQCFQICGVWKNFWIRLQNQNKQQFKLEIIDARGSVSERFFRLQIPVYDFPLQLPVAGIYTIRLSSMNYQTIKVVAYETILFSVYRQTCVFLSLPSCWGDVSFNKGLQDPPIIVETDHRLHQFSAKAKGPPNGPNDTIPLGKRKRIGLH